MSRPIRDDDVGHEVGLVCQYLTYAREKKPVYRRRTVIITEVNGELFWIRDKGKANGPIPHARIAWEVEE